MAPSLESRLRLTPCPTAPEADWRRVFVDVFDQKGEAVVSIAEHDVS